jgi:hypothetical protein
MAVVVTRGRNIVRLCLAYPEKWVAGIATVFLFIFHLT